MIRIGILGSSGRVGQHLVRLLETDFAARATVVATPEKDNDVDDLLSCDVIIDFSSADAMTSVAKNALSRPGHVKLPAFVIGTTGWKDVQKDTIEALARKTSVLMSSNFSTGVLVLRRILKEFAPQLMRLGYLPSMTETHHVHKKDAPSGTAILLNRAVEEAAHSGPIPTKSLRQGEVVGDHEMVFQGPADRITLSHSAQDRSIFARGAIEAALWLHEKRLRSGLLSMEDYLSDLFKQGVLK